MEELFQALSSSARIDKSKRLKKRKRQEEDEKNEVTKPPQEDHRKSGEASRDRTGKRDTSEAKQQQIHREQIAAFRRSMNIRLANKHDPDVPDPLSSFVELDPPAWWKTKDEASFHSVFKPILRNAEYGYWDCKRGHL